MTRSELVIEMFVKTSRLFHPQVSLWHGSKGDIFFLDFLEKQDGAVLPSEISTAMKLSAARVAMVLRVLEGKGWIERNTDPADRRKVLVTITPKGRETIKELRKKAFENTEKLIEAVGEEDIKEYIRIVDRIIKAAEKIDFDR